VGLEKGAKNALLLKFELNFDLFFDIIPKNGFILE
jgi:hypothetical protein